MVETLRARLAANLVDKVAGDEGPSRRDRILGADGPRWFADDRPIRRVHADASMFAGGLTALLMQCLHPLAMAGVAQHSGYRGDPWGRLARTSNFIAATTFGPDALARATVERVRAVHERVRGTAPDGRPYAASDPNLMMWVHLAEVASFLAAHTRFGTAPLRGPERDAYVADTAVVARALGIPEPPETEAALRGRIADYEPELAGTPQARDTARYLLLHPPLAPVARVPYALLAAAAVSLLPRSARGPLRLPYLPVVESTAVRGGGLLVVGGIRWVMGARRAPKDS